MQSLNNMLSGIKPLYSAYTAQFTPAATPTDVFVMEGAAGKTIYIWKVFISTLQTTAGVNTWFLNKHTTANAGGTAVATAKIPHDATGGPGASALVQHYTANPTPGTSLGSIATLRIDSPAPATAGIGSLQGYFVDFTKTHPIVLRNANEGIAWNFAGATLPIGLSVVAGVVWSEQ